MKAYFLMEAFEICATPSLRFIGWDEKVAEKIYRDRQVELLEEVGDWGENPNPNEVIPKGAFPYAPSISATIWESYCDRDGVSMVWIEEIDIPADPAQRSPARAVRL